jgi:hypothetical protein
MRLLVASFVGLLAGCAPTIPEPDADPSTRPADPDPDPDTGGPDDPLDADGDGSPVDEDCDDADPRRFPGAEERCDPVDRDCDGVAFTPDDCPCPEIAVGVGTFLVGCPEAATWTRARDLCALFDMRLVVPGDPTANGQVQALAESMRRGPAWIGVNDRDAEGRWVGVDGAPAIWTSWERGEPNDFGTGEDCAQLYPWNGRWNDASCDLSAPFVCEPDPSFDDR